MGQFVDLKSADGFVLPAWVAEPDTTPRGAVVVLQEIFGVNSHIRAVADRFAARGYLAVAPATFHRVKPGVELGYTADDMQAGMELKAAVEALPAPGVMPDIQAAIDYAAQRSGRKVGIVGFCWGGLLTWRAASLLTWRPACGPAVRRLLTWRQSCSPAWKHCWPATPLPAAATAAPLAASGRRRSSGSIWSSSRPRCVPRSARPSQAFHPATGRRMAVRPCFILRLLFGPSCLICLFICAARAWSIARLLDVSRGKLGRVFGVVMHSCIHLVMFGGHDVLPKNQFHIAR